MVHIKCWKEDLVPWVQQKMVPVNAVLPNSIPTTELLLPNEPVTGPSGVNKHWLKMETQTYDHILHAFFFNLALNFKSYLSEENKHIWNIKSTQYWKNPWS